MLGNTLAVQPTSLDSQRQLLKYFLQVISEYFFFQSDSERNILAIIMVPGAGLGGGGGGGGVLGKIQR